tara:strand:- start:526 stop:1275 length:750 start_codon:yes stop_codon:yes gene_type:complete
MNNLKAVFWDVDGTLANTEMDGHRKAFNSAFKEFKLNWHWDTDKYCELLDISGGCNRIKYFNKLNNYSLSEETMDSIHKRKQYLYKAIIETGEITLRPGVIRLIRELKSLSCQQWIVTTSSIVSLRSLLNSCFSSVLNCFNGFITYEDVKFHKPDPSAYLEVIKRCNMKRENCIVIEDSIIGLESAKSAGLKCLITISPWIKYHQNNYRNADSVVDNLGESNKHMKVFQGPIAQNGFINANYLDRLIDI